MQNGRARPWGVIPVHLNEMSADAATRTNAWTGLSTWILFASPPIPFNTFYAIMLDIMAIAGFEIVTIVTLAVLLLCGTEQHNKDFVQACRC